MIQGKNDFDFELQNRWRAAAKQRLGELYSIPGIHEMLDKLRKYFGMPENTDKHPNQ